MTWIHTLEISLFVTVRHTQTHTLRNWLRWGDFLLRLSFSSLELFKLFIWNGSSLVYRDDDNDVFWTLRLFEVDFFFLWEFWSSFFRSLYPLLLCLSIFYPLTTLPFWHTPTDRQLTTTHHHQLSCHALFHSLSLHQRHHFTPFTWDT